MPRAKVLVVDPNPGITMAARNVLVVEGYEAFVAGNVADAIRIANQAYPDMVVLDADLAVPPTLQALAQATRPNLEVILAVSSNDPTSIQLDDVRVVATIQKPFAPAALIDAIQRAVPEGDEDPTVEAFEPVDDAIISVETDTAAAGFETIEEEITFEDATTADTTPPTPGGVVALEGRVGPVPIEQIFHLAENMPGQVSLRFERAGQCIELFFVGRNLVFGSGLGLPPGFTFGRFLVDDGAIDAEILEDFVREHASAFRLLGKQLVRLGYIEPGALVRALERQLKLLVAEILRWPDAEFTLLRDVALPEVARTSGVALPVTYVLLEGMQKLDEWRRVLGEVGGLSAIPVRIDTADPPIDRLTPSQRALLAQVNGLRNVEDLARTARRPTYDVCQALAHLRHWRMVTVA